MLPTRNLCSAIVLVCVVGASTPGLACAADAIEFNRDIRPILADNCYACHGPDAGQRQAGLRLDQHEAALAALESGHHAIVPGDLGASELVRRILATDDAERMPPADSTKKLTEDQIALLSRWVKQGAPWQGHWSFLPVTRSIPPAGDSTNVQAIDQFVRAKLASAQVTPAAPAEAVTLARRVAFDLTGLPPTAEQVARFAAAPSDENYRQLVDELLASPRYGERMAMWWLDLVRYADSVGYHGDQPVSVYPFREYVIGAFNSNKPFDQFTRQQLAGDLLPQPTLEDKIASGYNRLGMMSAEGGVQPKEYLCKYIAERVRNISGAWLGATIGCAECHDHKFDPFATRDFYRMEAFFADIQERGLYSGANVDGHWGPSIQLPSPEQKAELARRDSEIAALKKLLATSTPELEAAQVTWERSVAPAIDWIAVRPVTAESSGGATLAVLDDHTVLASGAQPETDTYTLTFDNLPTGVTGFRLDTLPHDSLPAKGAGRAANGNFMLTEFVVRYRAAPESADERVGLQNATESFAQKSDAKGDARLTAAGAIDGDESPLSGWATVEEVTKPNHAVFEAADDLPGGEAGRLTIQLVQNRGLGGHTLGHFRLSVTTTPRPVKAQGSGLPRAVRDALAVAGEQRNKRQRGELAKYFRSIAPQLEPQRKSLADLQKARDEFDKQIPITLVTVAVQPRTIRVLPRGNWMDESGDVVEPGVPQFLPPAAPTDRRLTRLDLADWLTARENPLTARVFVNRLWELFFGAGLSRKLDDLGAQGEWPTHPELLDWLASEFMDSGWDIKHVVRSIVLSETYRQTSDRPELQESDPYNLLLARQSRLRFEAETVRDNALSVSGLLIERLGGPSVKPYQPPGYWAYLNFPTREWENGSGDDLYRRGLYTHWQRQYLHPSMLAFDAPSREECTADRPKSNTPLQALVLLNDATYVEAARVLAERILREGGATTDARLEFAFSAALSRPVRVNEAAVLGELVGKHREQYRQQPDAANQLLSVGARPVPTDLDPVELAAWTSVARTILNLHEMVTRY